MYQTEIDRAGERLEILRSRQNEIRLSESHHQYERQHSQRALDQIRKLSLSALWELPTHEQQRLLLQLMGNRRLVVKDRVIIGTADAPKYQRRPKRRQRHKAE